jgi:hypothetical protein
MPIKRSEIQLGTFEILHLLRGCCLRGCKLCFGPVAIARSYGRRPYDLKPIAAQAWRENRRRLLEMGRKPVVGARKAGFRAAAERGYGEFFPCFGEVIFDGVAWPEMDKKWPDEVKNAHESLSCTLFGNQ